MNPIPHASISFVFIDEWTLNTSEERKNEWINEWNNCSHTHTINIHLLFCLNACMQSIYQYFACSINTNARQICATIDFMCFNWLNVCRRRFLSLFLLLSFCLYCVRLFISCVFETALFVFFSSFLFDFQLFFVLERRLNSTRLYLLANVYAMIVLFVFFLSPFIQSACIENSHRWFSRADTKMTVSFFFFLNIPTMKY